MLRTAARMIRPSAIRTSLRGASKAAVLLGIAIMAAVLLRSLVVDTFLLRSASMQDTLLEGDYLVVNRLAVGGRVPFLGVRIPGYSRLRRYDVCILNSPSHPVRLVKRIVGMPGDLIEMKQAKVYINGTMIDEPWVPKATTPDGERSAEWQRGFLARGVDAKTYGPTRDNWGPLVLPSGTYFVLGDNRERSVDSREFGLVAEEQFEGRVAFVYFSYNPRSYRRFAWLREIRWGRLGHLIR